jgi:hypothetical protein
MGQKEVLVLHSQALTLFLLATSALAAERSVIMHFTPFFEFAYVVVVVGSLIVLGAAVWISNRVR